MYDTVRKATTAENESLALAVAKEENISQAEALQTVQQYEPIILDRYISDGPGYVGPVAVMVWGEPLFVSVYCWYTDDVDGDEWRPEDVNERTATT